jgi:HSP20 family molecular chaperone IbpA
MPVNVYETETGIAIDATLPGFDKDDIEVTLEEGRLSIRAEHNVESCEDARHDHEDRRYRYREVFRRRAERSFEIGDRFDSSAIQAELGKGVLHLELPRTETVQAQKIEIDGN